MARTDPHVRIRLPEELRTLLKQEAISNGRSMNAEIVARLSSLDPVGLRDRFAGQAPVCPEWFNPEGAPERPIGKLNEYGSEVGDAAHLAALAAWDKKANLWRLSREATWRYVFADAMLTARAEGRA